MGPSDVATCISGEFVRGPYRHTSNGGLAEALACNHAPVFISLLLYTGFKQEEGNGDGGEESGGLEGLLQI